MKKNTAINIAIEAMEKMRSRYAVGHNAFIEKQQSWDFIFIERDHKSYERISKAIEVVNDLRYLEYVGSAQDAE